MLEYIFYIYCQLSIFYSGNSSQTSDISKQFFLVPAFIIQYESHLIVWLTTDIQHGSQLTFSMDHNQHSAWITTDIQYGSQLIFSMNHN